MRLRTLLLPIAIMCYLLLMQSPAQAQNGSAMSSVVEARATHIAEVRIVAVTSVELDGTAYTVAEAEVVGTTKGSLPQTILIQVDGGELSDGRRVVISHQPYLAVGDHLDVALTSSPSQWAAAVVSSNKDHHVFSIVGGLDGAFAVTGDLQSQANATGDFGLTGAFFGEFPVNFYVNAANSGVSAASTRGAVQAGLQSWENDQGSDIDFTYMGATNLGGSLGDKKNVVYWTSTPNPAHSYLAQASWLTTGSGEILEFDVMFNRDYAWAAGAISGRWDIATVVRHESGHALGLAHVSVSTEVMYPSISSGEIKGLGAGDRSGAAHLYPTTSQDPARVVAAQAIVDGLESYAGANGNYVVSGGGWQGNGQGWFKAFPSGYPASIRNVLAYGGHFPNGIPSDPNGRDFLIYQCKDRIGVFSDTDSATSATSASNWWSSNGCTQYPANNGYTHLTLAAALPNVDPARIAGAEAIVEALKSYAGTNGGYLVYGGGWQGTGQGWFKAFPSGYPASIRNVLAYGGHFPNGIPSEPTNRDYLIYRCEDRVGVFTDTDLTESSPSAASWWATNGCTQYPINNGYTHLTLSDAVTSLDPDRVAAAAEIVDALESFASANGSYVVAGGGWQGSGQGRFIATPSGYPASIRSVLSNGGHFSNGLPEDPNDRDFMVYRCKDRVGVFADTDTATTDTADATWWANNGCTQYPITQHGYTHLTLSAPA